MALRKTTISVPEDVLDEIDRAARERHESRSAFITRILRAASRARKDREITRRLELLFSDGATNEGQRRTAQDLDELGTDWSEERW